MCIILGFHYTIMQWISVGVNLSWTDAYAVPEWANELLQKKLSTYFTLSDWDHKTSGWNFDG